MFPRRGVGGGGARVLAGTQGRPHAHDSSSPGPPRRASKPWGNLALFVSTAGVAATENIRICVKIIVILFFSELTDMQGKIRLENGKLKVEMKDNNDNDKLR